MTIKKIQDLKISFKIENIETISLIIFKLTTVHSKNIPLFIEFEKNL